MRNSEFFKVHNINTDWDKCSQSLLLSQIIDSILMRVITDHYLQ